MWCHPRKEKLKEGSRDYCGLSVFHWAQSGYCNFCLYGKGLSQEFSVCRARKSGHFVQFLCCHPRDLWKDCWGFEEGQKKGYRAQKTTPVLGIDTWKRENTMSWGSGLEIRKCSYFRGWLGTGTVLQGVAVALGLPDLQERLDNTLRGSVGLLGCPGRPQGIESMILVGLFQFRIFCGCMIKSSLQVPCDRLSTWPQ